MNRWLYIVIALLAIACNRQPSPSAGQQCADSAAHNTPKAAKSSLDSILRTNEPPSIAKSDSIPLLVRVRSLDSTIFVDLKYATEDNFTGQRLYPYSWDAYLQPVVAMMLVRASAFLREEHPELRLLVYDAARPLWVQRQMWEKVKDTPYKAYVASPDRTGLHNYGAAVDITLCDTLQNPLDMGTPFDFFGKKAGILHEDEWVRKGELKARQVLNRRLLRSVMLRAGFSTVSGEWWHFNACSLAEAKQRYALLQ